MSQGKSGRRRLARMSLAALLALVAIAGGTAGWYASPIRSQRATIRAIERAGGSPLHRSIREAVLKHGCGRPGPKFGWPSGWRGRVADRFGIDAVEPIAYVSLLVQSDDRGFDITDEQVELIGRLESLNSMYLNGNRASSTGIPTRPGPLATGGLAWGAGTRPAPNLSRLAGPRNLEFVEIAHAKISDDTLSALAGIAGLKHLKLVQVDLGGADLSRLGGLPRLESVDLVGTPVGGDGLRALLGIKALQSLGLDRKAFSLEVLPKLREEHPGIRIATH